MKKYRYLVVLISLLPAALSAQKIPVTVSGQIGQLDKPAVIYLVREGRLDSTYLSKGKFSFSIFIEAPTEALIELKPGRSFEDAEWMRIYLEKGHIKVETKTASLLQARVSGTPINRDNEDYKKLTIAVTAQLQQIRNAVKGLSPTQRALINDSLHQVVQGIVKQRNDLQLQYIKAHPASLLSLFLLSDYAGDRPDSLPRITGIEHLFGQLSKEVQGSKKGTDFRKFLHQCKNTAIGVKAPLFSQNDTAGHLVHLTDFSGKYLLIDFWASWCKPCRAVNPKLVRLWEHFHQKGFTILGISLDKNKDSWLGAIRKDHLSWTQLSDLGFWNNAVARMYSIDAIPRNFLLDKQGHILARDLSYEALTQVLDSLSK